MTASKKIPLGSLRQWLKWLLFVVVLLFVGRYGYRQWQQVNWSELEWSPGWLLLSGLVYFLGWLPAAWVWWRLLVLSSQEVSAYSAIRAHFCGHMGKYVPGKAMAVLIRAAMLRSSGVSTPLAAFLVVIETLLTMGTGLLLFVVLLPVVLGGGVSGEFSETIGVLSRFAALSPTAQWSISGGLLGLMLLAIPVWTRAANWLVGRLLRRVRLVQQGLNQQAAVQSLESLGARPLKLTSKDLLVCGLASAGGWVLNGLALGCVIAGLGLDARFGADLLSWTAAVCGATALGFFVLFAPGGLGVREGVLVAILQVSAGLSPALAVVVAVILRLVSLASEICFSCLFYFVPGFSNSSAVDTEIS